MTFWLCTFGSCHRVCVWSGVSNLWVMNDALLGYTLINSHWMGVWEFILEFISSSSDTNTDPSRMGTVQNITSHKDTHTYVRISDISLALDITSQWYPFIKGWVTVGCDGSVFTLHIVWVIYSYLLSIRYHSDIRHISSGWVIHAIAGMSVISLANASISDINSLALDTILT